ncbi:MAG: hypothetical protein MUC58_02445 [Rhizobiaceae bacterium]|nr:hypothetical protein [Rhizobiaceae bacterium]
MQEVEIAAAEMQANGPSPFAFRIALPADWIVAESSDTRLHADGLTLIGAFHEDGNAAFGAQAYGTLLRNEISAGNWLHLYFGQLDWAEPEVEEDGPRKARGSAAFDAEGTPMQALATATVNGPVLILLQAYCPAEDFAACRDVMNVAVQSLELERTEDPNIIEPWSAYGFDDGGEFMLPSSWQAKQAESDRPDRLAIDFTRWADGDRLEGFLRVKRIDVGSGINARDALALAIAEFESGGVSFIEPLRLTDEEAGGAWNEVISLVARNRTNPDHLLRFEAMALAGDAGTFVFACNGAAPEEEFLAWAINSRALQIALSSLEV